MRRSGEAGLAQGRRRKQPAEPWRMLQDLQKIPGVEGERHPQHRRQIFCPGNDRAPLLQPRILVPVEIVDQRISVRGRFAHGGFCCRECGFRARQQRIDRRQFRGQGDVVSRSLPSPDYIGVISPSPANDPKEKQNG